MAPSPLPQFIYKIVPSAPPSPLPEAYPLSDLDKQDGFVHLSTAAQIPITSDLFFKPASSLWVIKIRFASFAQATKWDGDGCAHLFGNFGAADVEAVKEFKKADGQSWGEAMKGHSWLV